MIPRASQAEYHVLQEGMVGPDGIVRSTVSLVVDGDRRIVVDPGMAPSQAAILEPLATLGFSAADVTDVVISHHHPDHTVNVGLFGMASVHDHWATYTLDRWHSRAAEGFEVSPSVMLWETPGHTPQDVTTLVATPEATAAFTHLWWFEAGPADDPYASDAAALHEHRARVLEVATVIVPGHGAPFAPSSKTPR